MKSHFLNLLTLGTLFLLGNFSAKGTHIAGGEITYTYLDTNTYRIRLSLFVDCYNGTNAAIAIDSTAFIAYYDPKTRNLLSMDEIKRSAPTRIEELLYNCVKFNSNACVDRYIYEYTKKIDPGQDGVVIAFQRCCRNGTISNLVNPQDVGATYWAYIPPDTVVKENSSPYFRKLPPNFLCTDAPLIFDHSAIDPDGDSLVYSLVAPYVGADRINNRPRPPASPTYTSVVFRSPYNVNQMMGATSLLKIDPNTGELRVTPDYVGQFVVGIKVSEYRNGVLLSEVVRDYQFNVSECEFETQANFINAERVCKDTVLFKDESKNAEFYKWDFGIQGRLDDTSNIANPFWLYPDDGTYKITLEVGKSTCRDTFYNYVTVVHADSIHARFLTSDDEACKKLEVCFTNKSDKTPDRYWDLGLGTEALHNEDPPCTVYSVPGRYDISLIIIDSTKCNISDTVTKPVWVFRPPEANAGISKIECEGWVKYANLSFPDLDFEWEFFGTDTSVGMNRYPHIHYNRDSTFPARLIVWDNNCRDTAELSVKIDLNNFVSADVSPTIANKCAPLTLKFNHPAGKPGNSVWDMGDGNLIKDSFPDHYVYDVPGDYTLKITVSNDSTCNGTDSFIYTFNVPFRPEANMELSLNECMGKVEVQNYSSNAKSYQWDFGDGAVSDKKEPDHQYSALGNYQITLIADPDGPCPDTVSQAMEIKIVGLENLKIPNIFTPNSDGLNECYKIDGVSADCYDYEFIIYNRWGDRVFETNDINACWDGKTKDGKAYPAGTYFAIYRFTRIDGSEENEISGTITLLR